MIMAKKLNSPTSLTEFAPLTPEGDSKPFSFRNFFKKGKEKEIAVVPDEIKEGNNSFDSISAVDPMQENCGLLHSSSQPSTAPATPINVDVNQNRNMTSVLEMMKNIIEGKKMGGLQSYKDSDFKQYWMPDSNCKECYECGDKFTTFRRRHHCRICGQIFCRRCCNQGIPGNLIGYSGDLRVCSYCYRMVSSCMQSSDSDSELSDEMQSFHDLQCDISVQRPSEKLSSSQQSMLISSRRKSSVMGFREEDIARAKLSKSTLDDFRYDVEYSSNLTSVNDSSLHDQASLSDLFHQLLLPESGIMLLKDVSHPQLHYARGCDIVEWLLNNNAAVSSADAVNIGQAFIDGGFLECETAGHDRFSNTGMLYKLKVVRPEVKHVDSVAVNHESMEPLWVKEIQNTDSCSIKDGSVEDSSQSSTVCSDLPKSRSRSRFPSSSSSFYLDLDVKESTVKVSRPLNKAESKHFSPATSCMSYAVKESAEVSCDESFAHGSYLNEGIHDTFTKELLKAFNVNYLSSLSKTSAKSSEDFYATQQLKGESDKLTSFENINSAYEVLETNLLRQLLENNQLASAWYDVILPIIHHVIDAVHPDVKNDADSMDIRQYVQFKKIPGGSKTECTIVNGVVFSKTVAHRKMQQNVLQPTVLLLSSPIAYQRTENKISSLDPVIMQEFEYLKNTIGKLTICKPSVLLVERSVSRLAQEMLLDLGITVALNVKPTVMERVARCTQAAIVSTIDAHLGKPQLGKCEHFRVKTFCIPCGKSKTLMFLDGCLTNLGCTILLRGGSANELKKVKQIVQFMLYVAYNWRLERSFLKDEFAVLPQLDTENILDTVDSEADSKLNPDMSDVNELKIRDGDITSPNDANFFEPVEHPTQICTTSDSQVKTKSDDVNRRLEAKCIDDFSDPLHSYLQLENDVVFTDSSNLQVATVPVSNSFRKLLGDIILCCSLNVKVELPYLETEAGKHCRLRKFFPDDLYWSAHFLKENEIQMLHSTQVNFEEENEPMEVQISSRNVEILPAHPFTYYKIIDISSTSLDVNSYLSDYRARGGTIIYLCPHQCALRGKEKKTLNTQNSVEKEVHKINDVNTNTGLCWERKVDALDPYNHQKLAVLFCSYSCSSNNAPNYCVSPWLVKMDFYGSNDIPFGGFLEKYCFRSAYVCPSSTCDTKMTEHVRKFVHGSGCVHILLHELSSGVQTADNSILMWSWCHKCKQASSVVPMSEDTWAFSFAKYLELRFYASSYVRQSTSDLCSHSLHHDHYQYFAHKQTVAIFEYNPITVWEIVLPSVTIIIYDEALPISSVVDQIKCIAIKGSEMYSTILEKLFAFKQQYVGTHCEDIVANMIAAQKIEMCAFREKIEQIQWRLTSPTLETMQANTTTEKTINKGVCNAMWKIEDQVHFLKYYIAEAVQSWNNRIQDFVSARKKEEKLSSKVQQTKVNESEEVFSSNSASTAEDSSCIPMTLGGENNAKAHEYVTHREHLSNHLRPPVVFCSHEVRQIDPSSKVSNFLQMKSNRFHHFSWLDRSVSCESISETLKSIQLKPRLFKAYSEPKGLSYNIESPCSALEEEVTSNCSSASSYTYGVTPGIYAGLMVPQPEDNETYVVCHKDTCDQKHFEGCLGRGHERSKSEGHQMFTDSFSRTPQEREDVSKREKKERTVKTILSQFLSGSDVALIQSPFPPTEHIIASKGEKEKIPVILYDDEPSSIIAYTLASTEYEQQLQEMRVNLTTALSGAQRDSQTSSPLVKRRQNSRQLSENLCTSESSLPIDDSADFLDLVVCSSQETDKGGHKSGNKLSNFHLEIQFSDNSARFYCRVYYAEQFRKLRCLVFNEGEERFIRSLRHCIPWVARGGKSGSTFCKTRDDRFILKQMQKLELQSFLDLAPSYFQYVNKACVEQRPTLLAKIVGVYRIGYKNSVTNTASKMDLLIMENLFYGCNITRKYDLKGSVRNRLVNTSGLQEDDIVLLDENLLKITCDNPLYIRPHSKSVLTSAIDNDTHFLSDQSVMDYSLLVGLDEEKTELVVGIIDYIRTFTWDKKVEMFVKSSGILGGHGKMPTVVSPELYRMRFREAMDGYFLWVPDRWTNLAMDGDI